MAARSSCAHIITRVRRLVNDTSGSPVFTDDEYQDTLDQRRADVRYYELIPTPTLSGPPTAGTVQWLDFYAPAYAGGWWEEDEQVLSNVWAALTPVSSDRVVGHWTFAVTQLPPLYLIGKNFDLYGAAADVLELWIAMLKLEYDTRQNRVDLFQRQQRITTMTGLAEQYRAKQRPQSVDLVRDDTGAGSNPNWFSLPFSTR